RRLFLSLVHVAADTADTRRRVQTGQLLADQGTQAAAMEEVLDLFVARRLITAHTDTVEISHEALLSAWPRLRRWLDADRTSLVVGRRLADAADAWQREHHDPAALYRGTRLDAAKEWAAGHTTELRPSTAEFLDASTRYARRRVRRLGQV